MPERFVKDPDAVLDFTFDFAPLTNGREGAGSDWLDTANSEVISTHTITAETGITVDSSSQTDTNTSVTVWLSGGTAGTTYTVACKIVTDASRTEERSIKIYVKER